MVCCTLCYILHAFSHSMSFLKTRSMPTHWLSPLACPMILKKVVFLQILRFIYFFFCLSVGTGLHLGFLPLYDVSDKYDNCEAGKPLGSHPVQCLPPPCLVHQHSLSSVWPLSGLHVECLFSLSLGRSSERQLRQFRGSYCPFPEGSRFLETCSCICEVTGANGKRTEQFGLQFGKS